MQSKLPIIIAAVAIPVVFSMFRAKAGGFNIRLSDGFFLLAIFFAILCSRGVFWRIAFSPALSLTWLFFLYIIIQGCFLGFVDDALKEFAQITFLFFGCIACCYFCELNKKTFKKYFIIALTFSVLTTIYYHFSTGIYYSYKHAGDGRYVFGNLSVISFLLWFKTRNKYLKWLFVCSIIPLLASMERRGLYGLVITVLLMYVSIKFNFFRFGAKNVFFAFWLFFSLLLSIFFLDNTLINKIMVNFDHLGFVDEDEALWISNVHRKALLVNGFDIFLRSPVFGSGPDQVKILMQDYFFDPRLANGTHNFYLDTLIKYGLVGFFLMLAGIFSIFNSIRRDATNVVYFFYCLFSVGLMADGAAAIVMMFSAVLVNIFTESEV